MVVNLSTYIKTTMGRKLSAPILITGGLLLLSALTSSAPDRRLHLCQSRNNCHQNVDKSLSSGDTSIKTNKIIITSPELPYTNRRDDELMSDVDFLIGSQIEKKTNFKVESKNDQFIYNHLPRIQNHFHIGSGSNLEIESKPNGENVVFVSSTVSPLTNGEVIIKKQPTVYGVHYETQTMKDKPKRRGDTSIEIIESNQNMECDDVEQTETGPKPSLEPKDKNWYLVQYAANHIEEKKPILSQVDIVLQPTITPCDSKTAQDEVVLTSDHVIFSQPKEENINDKFSNNSGSNQLGISAPIVFGSAPEGNIEIIDTTSINKSPFSQSNSIQPCRLSEEEEENTTVQIPEVQQTFGFQYSTDDNPETSPNQKIDEAEKPIIVQSNQVPSDNVTAQVEEDHKLLPNTVSILTHYENSYNIPTVATEEKNEAPHDGELVQSSALFTQNNNGEKVSSAAPETQIIVEQPREELNILQIPTIDHSYSIKYCNEESITNAIPCEEDTLLTNPIIVISPESGQSYSTQSGSSQLILERPEDLNIIQMPTIDQSYSIHYGNEQFYTVPSQGVLAQTSQNDQQNQSVHQDSIINIDNQSEDMSFVNVKPIDSFSVHYGNDFIIVTPPTQVTQPDNIPLQEINFGLVDHVQKKPQHKVQTLPIDHLYSFHYENPQIFPTHPDQEALIIKAPYEDLNIVHTPPTDQSFAIHYGSDQTILPPSNEDLQILQTEKRQEDQLNYHQTPILDQSYSFQYSVDQSLPSTHGEDIVQTSAIQNVPCEHQSMLVHKGDDIQKRPVQKVPYHAIEIINIPPVDNTISVQYGGDTHDMGTVGSSTINPPTRNQYSNVILHEPTFSTIKPLINGQSYSYQYSSTTQSPISEIVIKEFPKIEIPAPPQIEALELITQEISPETPHGDEYFNEKDCNQPAGGGAGALQQSQDHIDQAKAPDTDHSYTLQFSQQVYHDVQDPTVVEKKPPKIELIQLPNVEVNHQNYVNPEYNNQNCIHDEKRKPQVPLVLPIKTDKIVHELPTTNLNKKPLSGVSISSGSATSTFGGLSNIGETVKNQYGFSGNIGIDFGSNYPIQYASATPLFPIRRYKISSHDSLKKIKVSILKNLKKSIPFVLDSLNKVVKSKKSLLG